MNCHKNIAAEVAESTAGDTAKHSTMNKFRNYIRQ
jgi:hypothetical protein